MSMIFDNFYLRFLQLLTLSNLFFLVMDVCLPFWDIVSDIIVINNYWSRSNFTWVSQTGQKY